LVRRAVVLGLPVCDTGLRVAPSRLAHLPQKKGRARTGRLGQFAPEAPFQGRFRLGPSLLPHRQFPSGQPHSGGPRPRFRLRAQPRTQGVRGLCVAVGRNEGAGQPEPRFLCALSPYRDHLSKFLGRPYVVLPVVARPTDQHQRVVYPLRVRMGAEQIGTFLDRLLERTLPRTGLRRGEYRDVARPVHRVLLPRHRRQALFEGRFGVVVGVVVGREVVVLPSHKRAAAAPRNQHRRARGKGRPPSQAGGNR
jgi:hypothetical protein